MSHAAQHHRPVNRREFARRSLAAFCGTLSAAQWFTSPPMALAQGGPEQTATRFVTRNAQLAIDGGLAYLSKQQIADGSFGRAGFARNIAVCALSGMAFLSSGSTPGRGPYGAAVNRCVDFILAHCQASGFIYLQDTSSHGPMYEHGFATLFLAEVYGMTLRGDVREKLAAAVNLIVQTQNNEGGWRYQPQRRDADISVTICQIMALRAARNAGIHVPRETIDHTIEYVKRSQNPDGGFMYMLQGTQSLFPRSAAGVVALYSAGIYEGPEIEKGLAYLMSYLPQGDHFQRDNHYFYGQYYAVQAMWQAGGTHWEKWYPAIREELLSLQQDDGSWLVDHISPVYSTAMACIILQMPNNYLPIFQR